MPDSLPYFRKALKRQNVPRKVQTDYFAREEFLDVIYSGYLVQAFLEFGQMDDLGSIPKGFP